MLTGFLPLLSGGYESFHSQYPELCTEVKIIDQSVTETEKRVNSNGEKLSHRKPDYDQVRKHPSWRSRPTSYSAARASGASFYLFSCTNVCFFSKYTHPSPADIRETYIWHQNISIIYVRPADTRRQKHSFIADLSALPKQKACGCFTSCRALYCGLFNMNGLHNRGYPSLVHLDGCLCVVALNSFLRGGLWVDESRCIGSIIHGRISTRVFCML